MVKSYWWGGVGWEPESMLQEPESMLLEPESMLQEPESMLVL